MAQLPPPPPPARETYPDYTGNEARGARWKYEGYRLYSKWVASEKTFFIVRRFGALNTRIILALQDEIVQLEQDLNRLDEENSRKSLADDTNNGSFRYDQLDERRKLVQKTLPDKLLKYSMHIHPQKRRVKANSPDSFVNEYAQLVDRPPVYPDDLKEVKKWLQNVHRGAIQPVERAYIDKDDDLIPVQPKIRSSFRNFLEKSRLFLGWGFMKEIFGRTPTGFYDVEKDDTYWQNDSRLESFASVIISVIGLIMLVGPLWILEYVVGTPGRLGIITGFITVFFIIVLLLTTARVFDALVAAAAYSAVLMVFLQLGSNSAV